MAQLEMPMSGTMTHDMNVTFGRYYYRCKRAELLMSLLEIDSYLNQLLNELLVNMKLCSIIKRYKLI
jgi:hypothetical protein